ncbi:hypothetical protein ACJX0J_009079, partial [Zea mays]
MTHTKKKKGKKRKKEIKEWTSTQISHLGFVVASEELCFIIQGHSVHVTDWDSTLRLSYVVFTEGSLQIARTEIPNSGTGNNKALAEERALLKGNNKALAENGEDGIAMFILFANQKAH